MQSILLTVSFFSLLLFSFTLRLNRYRFRRGEDAIVLLGALGTFCPLLVTHAMPAARVTVLDYLLAALVTVWSIWALGWFLHEIHRLQRHRTLTTVN